jgi:hypothetical protein
LSKQEEIKRHISISKAKVGDKVVEDIRFGWKNGKMPHLNSTDKIPRFIGFVTGYNRLIIKHHRCASFFIFVAISTCCRGSLSKIVQVSFLQQLFIVPLHQRI